MDFIEINSLIQQLAEANAEIESLRQQLSEAKQKDINTTRDQQDHREVKNKQETKVIQSINKFCENGNESQAMVSEGFCPG